MKLKKFFVFQNQIEEKNLYMITSLNKQKKSYIYNIYICIILYKYIYEKKKAKNTSCVFLSKIHNVTIVYMFLS